jgi:pyroglutamyl-peptidase
MHTSKFDPTIIMATTTAASDGNKDAQPPVTFVVTGFGPFRNARENPTTIIANRLVEYLKNNDQASLALRTSTRIIETSAQAARCELDTMLLQEQSPTFTTVYLHLGVNYKGTQFQLEQCAYNDATFRIPDEQGYQPRNKCIVDNVPLKSSLTTLLDLETICDALHTMAPVIVSTDPGRFVCNYTYYYSLTKTRQTPGVHSLFVHVPPFGVISEETQMKVVMEILQCIDTQLSNQATSVPS